MGLGNLCMYFLKSLGAVDAILRIQNLFKKQVMLMQNIGQAVPHTQETISDIFLAAIAAL